MNDSTLRVGIAGANAGARHAQAVAALENVELAALADPDETLRQPLAESLGIPRQFEDALELIESGAVDAVVIATPSDLRERQVNAAFDAGLHVLSESPVGISSGQASRLVTAAGLVNKVFMASCPWRFDPRAVEARRLVDEGALGEVFRAECAVHLAQWPHPPNSWRLDRERGGGALMEAGLEALDLAWYALGCPDAREAMAARYDLFSRAYAKEVESVAEDALAGTVRFKNGASLQISVQIHQASSTGSDERRLRLWGSKGALDLLAGCRVDPDGSSDYAQVTRCSDRYLAQAKAFAAAIMDDQPALAPGKQSLGLMKMVDALLASAKEKEAVAIKVERSLDDLFGSL